MGPAAWIRSLGLLLLCAGAPPALAGRVLVFPGEYSHWLNARTIMDELVRRNHSVTVLVADASPSVGFNDTRDAAKFNFLVFKVATIPTLPPPSEGPL